MATFFKSALELLRLQQIILEHEEKIKLQSHELQLVKHERTLANNERSKLKEDFVTLERNYDVIWDERKSDKKTIDELYSKNQLLENKLDHYTEQHQVQLMAIEELKKQCNKLNKSRNYYKEFVRNVLSEEE